MNSIHLTGEKSDRPGCLRIHCYSSPGWLPMLHSIINCRAGPTAFNPPRFTPRALHTQSFHLYSTWRQSIHWFGLLSAWQFSSVFAKITDGNWRDDPSQAACVSGSYFRAVCVGKLESSVLAVFK